MQEFYIKQGSINPVLRMEVIQDGRYDFGKNLLNNALEDSIVTFSMKDIESGMLKISNAPADIVVSAESGCEEKYILQYKWKERDTKKEGIYEGWFEIKFNGNISEDGVEYPKGNLIVPIQEGLQIYVK